MTGDRVTANLPSRDFGATAAFWKMLGFGAAHLGSQWMILRRDTLVVEFFPHPQLAPRESWFSACIRVADIDALHAEWAALELPDTGVPRFAGWQDWGADAPRGFALVDADGTLLRVLQTES